MKVATKMMLPEPRLSLQTSGNLELGCDHTPAKLGFNEPAGISGCPVGPSALHSLLLRQASSCVVVFLFMGGFLLRILAGL